MFVLVSASAATGFVLGVIFSNWRKHRKHINKRGRRNLILAMKDRIFDEIYRWNLEHPKIISLNAPKGQTIFKGDANLMTEEQFAKAVRMTK